MSRFFTFLSRYAYCKAFSTLSLATRMQFFALPLNPFASWRTLSLCMCLRARSVPGRYGTTRSGSRRWGEDVIRDHLSPQKRFYHALLMPKLPSTRTMIAQGRKNAFDEMSQWHPTQCVRQSVYRYNYGDSFTRSLPQPMS
jgi:hypothetical protein